MMSKEEIFVPSKSGETIRIVQWKPSRNPKALMLIAHGYAGHIDRYDALAMSMLQDGICCIGLDLQGHGKSSGKRAYVERFDDYILDYQTAYDFAVKHYPDLPLFLFGHSMGAVITSLFVIEHQPPIKGVLLSGIALFVTDSIPAVLVKLSGIVSKWWPTLPTTKLKAQLTSSQAQQVARYEEDPLIYHGGIRARTGYELMKAAERTKENISRFLAPVFLIHGESDKLANVEGSKYFYRKAGSTDKKLLLVKEGYHEVLYEKQTAQITGEMLEWMAKRIG